MLIRNRVDERESLHIDFPLLENASNAGEVNAEEEEEEEGDAICWDSLIFVPSSWI